MDVHLNFDRCSLCRRKDISRVLKDRRIMWREKKVGTVVVVIDGSKSNKGFRDVIHGRQNFSLVELKFNCNVLTQTADIIIIFFLNTISRTLKSFNYIAKNKSRFFITITLKRTQRRNTYFLIEHPQEGVVQYERHVHAGHNK